MKVTILLSFLVVSLSCLLTASGQSILDCTQVNSFSWPTPANAYDSQINGIKLSTQNLQLTRTIFGGYASGEIVRGTDLVALTPEFPLSDLYKQSVAGPSGDFGIFIVIQTVGTSFLYLQHYDSNGTPLGGAQTVFQTMGSIDTVEAVLLSDQVNIAIVIHEVSGAISGVIFNDWQLSIPAFSIGTGASFKLTTALSSAKFTVTWIDPSSNLKFRIYRSNGSPLSGSPTTVSSLATNFGVSTLIDVSDQFVIGWVSTKDLSQTVTGGYVFGQVFSSSGVASSPVFSIRTKTNDVVIINGVSTAVIPDSVSFVTFPNGLFIALYRVPRFPYPPGTAYLYARSYLPSGDSLNTSERIVLPLTKDAYIAMSLKSGGWVVVAQYFRRDPPIAIGLVFKSFYSIYDLVGIENYPIPSAGTFAFKRDIYRIPSKLFEVAGNSQQSSLVLIWDSANDVSASTGVSGLQCVLRESQCYNDFQAITPEVIEPIQTIHDQRFPSVSTFQNTQVVVWQSDSLGNGKWDIISRFNNSATEKKLNSIKAGYLANPSVAMPDESSYFTVWQELNQDGSGWGIYGTLVFPFFDSVPPEFRINDYTPSNQINPVISCAAYGGRCVVVWQSLNQDAATGYGVYGKELTISDLEITGISTEFRVNSITLNNQQNPKVAVLPDGGRFVVTWEHMTDGDGWGVYYKVVDWFDVNSNVAALPGPDIRANQIIAGNQIHPSVAAIGTSNQFVIAWLTQHGTNDIVARLFDPTGPISDEFFVTTVSGTQLGYLSVAPFYVGWAVSWIGTDGVFIKTFNGTALKDSVQVNTAIVGTQPATPSLAGAPYSTSLKVSWESSQIDGSGYGVAIRSFGCIP